MEPFPLPQGLKRNVIAISEETAMGESISGMLLGVIALIVAAILVVEHYRREHYRKQELRWLDTDRVHGWVHCRP